MLFRIRKSFEMRSTVLLTRTIGHVFPCVFSTVLMWNVEVLCLSRQMKMRHARVRNDPYKVIRERSFPVYFESTSRNEMQLVTVAL